MPNKHTTDGNYRYAFQGQEKDPETGMEAFELRLWDGKLGRWLTVDPYHEFHSPYVGMGNNPISLIDPDGGSTEGGGDPPSFWSRLWNKITGNTSSEYQEIPEANDGAAYSQELREIVVTQPSIKCHHDALFSWPPMNLDIFTPSSVYIMYGSNNRGRKDFGRSRGPGGEIYGTMNTQDFLIPFASGGATLKVFMRKANSLTNAANSGRAVVAGIIGGYQAPVDHLNEPSRLTIIDTIHFAVWSEGETNYYRSVKDKNRVDSIRRANKHKVIHKMEFVYE